MIRQSLVAAALCLGLAGPAAAFPAGTAALGLPLDTGVMTVAGGCGPYGHRGPYGGCRPGGQAGYRPYGGYRPCPPGYHLGRYGRRCFRY